MLVAGGADLREDVGENWATVVYNDGEVEDLYDWSEKGLRLAQKMYIGPCICARWI